MVKSVAGDVFEHQLLTQLPAELTSVNFWEIRVGLPYDECIELRDATLEAIKQVLASGVKSYHVGSRGLERLSLEDLRKMYEFWQNAANDALLGPSSAIQSRRAVPCDV